jgi:uncharacterized protein (TIGR00290 family)
VSWSGGKDSLMALADVRRTDAVEVTGLLTTVNASAGRVAMHAVRRSLLEAQAAALGLPLHVVELPWPCPNGVYEQQMAASVDAARQVGVTRMVFGDLFLADVRSYRETMLAGTGVAPVFPLWGRPTDRAARQMIDAGIRAVLTCVDPTSAPAEIAGRWYDDELLAGLPPAVDRCGEHGEFHTFAVDGPGFAVGLDVTVGETVVRDGFVFTDVLPLDGASNPQTAAGHSRAASSGRAGSAPG